MKYDFKGSNYHIEITSGEKNPNIKPSEAQVWSFSTGSSPQVGSPPLWLGLSWGFAAAATPAPRCGAHSDLQHQTRGPHQRSTLLWLWRHSPSRGTKHCPGNGWLGFMYNLQLSFRAVRQAPPQLERSRQTKLNTPLACHSPFPQRLYCHRSSSWHSGLGQGGWRGRARGSQPSPGHR